MIIEKYKKKIENYLNEKFILSYPIEIQEYLIYIFKDGKKIRPILYLLFSGHFNKYDTNNITTCDLRIILLDRRSNNGNAA
jgi:geranylgeranyl pyrophosphate synthase